jgi:hypothetical protein
VFACQLLVVAEVVVAGGKVKVFEAYHCSGRIRIRAYENHELNPRA